MASATPREWAFRAGSRISGASAETVAGELARIDRQDGGLTPERVVEEAAPEASPLHPCFEWDDKKAAHEHRLHQARHLIRSVVVIVEEQPQQVFTYVPHEDKGSYRPVSVVARSLPMAEAAISHLRGNLQAARRSLQELIASIRTEADSAKHQAAQRVRAFLDKAAEELETMV